MQEPTNQNLRTIAAFPATFLTLMIGLASCVVAPSMEAGDENAGSEGKDDDDDEGPSGAASGEYAEESETGAREDTTSGAGSTTSSGSGTSSTSSSGSTTGTTEGSTTSSSTSTSTTSGDGTTSTGDGGTTTETSSPSGEEENGDSGVFMPSTGAPRSMGYLGCSMSVNVAEGYEMLDGQRLWPPIAQYNGQVVQNWANNNDAVWGAFENAMNQYGAPEDVWVMLCIFSNMVTLDEARQIVANVRSRVPDATVYITGQPLYDDPNSCFLAGNGGPDLTDSIAQQAAADASLNVIYPGAFGPLGGDQNSDGCHANDNGRLEIGQQFIDWFGS